MEFRLSLKGWNAAVSAVMLTCAITFFGSNDAEALGMPQGDVLLVIDGDINMSNATRNGTPVAEFDLSMLQRLGKTSFTTNTPWTDKTEFTGVRLNTLLSSVGASLNSSVVRAFAMNDYWFDLRSVDADTYPVIIAYERNGDPMSLRELGPLWLIFPFDDYPELLTEKNKASSVWQLIGLTVQ